MNSQAPGSAVEAKLRSFLAEPQRLLIGGEWVQARSGETIDVSDPATGLVFASQAAASAADVDAAVRAARTAFEQPAWTAMPPAKRRKLLLDLADAIEQDADFLAHLETLNNGMPLMAARGFGVGHAIEVLRYASGWVGKLNGETLTASHAVKHVYTVREPVGVVAAIMPWNGPVAMAADQIAGALATGCTVILKPAELTPLSAIRLGQLALKVGFPPGVINIVTGYGHTAGAALSAHPGVNKINFTGSTAVGRAIAAAATVSLKRVTLELGGKSPVLVFADADIDRVIAGASMGIFANSGQICVAGSRLYVHARVFDRVVEGIAANAKAMPIGSGFDPRTRIGPLISQRQRDRVAAYIDSGVQAGAAVIAGGGIPGGEGFFIEPTVLARTTSEMRIVQEEIFGPVLCAMRFEDDDLDGIAALANATEYGLSSYVWTRDLSVAHKMAKKIRAGSVVINDGPVLDVNFPAGGFKQSGVGRLHGREGLDSYLETKTVSINLDDGHDGH